MINRSLGVKGAATLVVFAIRVNLATFDRAELIGKLNVTFVRKWNLRVSPSEVFVSKQEVLRFVQTVFCIVKYI